MEPKMISPTAPTNAATRRMMVRHPTGTNHFQLRVHQFGRSGIPGGRMFVGVPMMLSLSRRPNDAIFGVEDISYRTCEHVRREWLLQEGCSRNAMLQHLVVGVAGDIKHLHLRSCGTQLLC